MIQILRVEMVQQMSFNIQKDREQKEIKHCPKNGTGFEEIMK